MEKTLNLVKNDPWLEPFAGAITGRHQHVLDKEAELTNKGKQTLSDFASGYLYFGLHRTDKGWTFGEWAPNATHIYMVGTFNNWEEKAAYKLKKQKRKPNWKLITNLLIFKSRCREQKLWGIPLQKIVFRQMHLTTRKKILLSSKD